MLRAHGQTRVRNTLVRTTTTIGATGSASSAISRRSECSSCCSTIENGTLESGSPTGTSEFRHFSSLQFSTISCALRTLSTSGHEETTKAAPHVVVTISLSVFPSTHLHSTLCSNNRTHLIHISCHQPQISHLLRNSDSVLSMKRYRATGQGNVDSPSRHAVRQPFRANVARKIPRGRALWAGLRLHRPVQVLWTLTQSNTCPAIWSSESSEDLCIGEKCPFQKMKHMFCKEREAHAPRRRKKQVSEEDTLMVGSLLTSGPSGGHRGILRKRRNRDEVIHAASPPSGLADTFPQYDAHLRFSAAVSLPKSMTAPHDFTLPP